MLTKQTEFIQKTSTKIIKKKYYRLKIHENRSETILEK